MFADRRRCGMASGYVRCSLREFCMVIRTLSSLILILVAGTHVCPAQTASLISEIRAEVGKINADLPKYAKRVKTVLGVSLEGAEATYYYDGKNLKRVSAKLHGETYNAVLDLYYRGDVLFFAYQKLNRYDTQIGMQPPPKVVSSEEKRLYFSTNGLAALRIGQTDVEPEDVRWREAEEEIVEVADRLKAAQAS
jgi:hypothetical protein